MPIEKGTIFTPDKKSYLIEEVKNEIASVDAFIRKKLLAGKSLQLVKSVRERLQKTLNNLYDKKGVVTPQETDSVLELIDESKRTRLETQYYFGMKRTTIYLIALLAVGVGIYFYTKKTNA